MIAIPSYPVAMTIAGSDSSGGAGIQADLATFAELDVHGTTVITALTAQNPERVDAIRLVPPDFVRAQFNAVVSEMPVLGLKTGMLGDRELIETVADLLQTGPQQHVVVDPVMVATSGAQLLSDDGVAAMQSELLPLATVVTPNLNEAALLLSAPVADTKQAMEQQAQHLHARFGCAVVLKGGHRVTASQSDATADDVLVSAEGLEWFSAQAISGADTHGTGCTLSAAITAHLANGLLLSQAVAAAKGYVTKRLEASRDGAQVPLQKGR